MGTARKPAEASQARLSRDQSDEGPRNEGLDQPPLIALADLLLTLAKRLPSPPPNMVMPAIAVTAIIAAIRPYSIAVAPPSSRKNRCRIVIVVPLSQQLAERRNQRAVRGWHGVVAQVARPHPFDRRMLQSLRDALPPTANVEWH